MASEKELRETVRRLAVTTGADSLEALTKAGLSTEGISSTKRAKIERWLRKISPGGLSSTLQPQMQRWVNHFKLGADPEFVFTDPEEDTIRIDPAQMGLRPGFAFGADNNGRLVEIRPAPNVSALKVTASILHTMRWLVTLYPETLRYMWRCFPIILRDGVGGHVHFGRKQPSRPQEIKALNHLTACLTLLSIFDKGGLLARPDSGYGRPNDWRKQVYGYEYRSMPSWLDSPEQAFIVLTLTKLAVHDPELFAIKPTEQTAGIRLYRALAYYRPKDDDAALALIMLQRLNTFPQWYGRDFKGRWGIGFPLGYTPCEEVSLIPQAIEADAFAIEDMYKYLLLAEPIPARIPVCNWEVARHPTGFRPLFAQNHAREIGMGDLVAGLFSYEGCPVQIAAGSGGRLDVTVPAVYFDNFSVAFRSALKSALGNVSSRVTIAENGQMTIYVPRWLRENDTIVPMRQFLLSGLLPLWESHAATLENCAAWRAQFIKENEEEGPLVSLETALTNVQNAEYLKTAKEQRKEQAARPKKAHHNERVLTRQELKSRVMKKKKKRGSNPHVEALLQRNR